MATIKHQFNGFSKPVKNFFMMPNEWTNITASMKSLAEIKTVEYILRHTWGYQEYGIAKKITIDEFMHGRKRSDGTRMDEGTGLSKPSVVDGLKNAVKHGYLTEQVDDRDKARLKKSYALKMADEKMLDADVKILNIRGRKLDSGGKDPLHRSEKETSETHSKKTVGNGDQSPLMKLPRLDQPDDKTDVLADDILAAMGDSHSYRFYRHVAARIPEDVIRKALSEIKSDGAENPAKVFTFRMNQYALTRLK